MEVSAEVVAQRARTAMVRYDLSRPLKMALRAQLLKQDETIFDYGCGKGTDVEILSNQGFQIMGWDPHFHKEIEKCPSVVINLGYVLNVIENPIERVFVLKSAFQLSQKLLIVSVLMDTANVSSGQKLGDGCLTGRQTFQKYFSHDEITSLILETVGTHAYCADRGIYFVFKCEDLRAEYLYRKSDRSNMLTGVMQSLRLEKGVKIRVPNRTDLIEAHIKSSELVGWIESRGRLPNESEFSTFADLYEIASKGKIEGWALSRVNQELYQQSREMRKEDIRLFLAELRLDKIGRPQQSALPVSLREDIKEFFGFYSTACSESDIFLANLSKKELISKAITESLVGKKLPDAIYIHYSALQYVPNILRLFIGCAELLVGDIGEDTLIKISKSCESVSFLYYPNFDLNTHPELAISVKVNVYTRKVQTRDYTKSDNPPILHRKELFVHESYPLHSEFMAVSDKEEALGLLGRTDIGFKKGWEQVVNNVTRF